MPFLEKYKFTTFYCVFVILSAIGFHYYPMVVMLPDSWGAWTPWTLAVGLWFVLRDFAQRELGHKVLIPMLGATIISAFINPQFAIASLAAAAASELIDWLIYTVTKKPFHQRILLSSLASAPADSIIFLLVTDVLKILPFPIFTWAGIVTGVSAKLVAALIIFFYYKKKNQSGSEQPNPVGA